MRFTARLTSQEKRQPLLEDAPRPLRVGYLKGILGKFVGESNYRGHRTQPLDTQETHAKFIALVREEADPWDFDNQSSWEALSHHLKACTWSEFYDFVELIGALLLEKDDEIPFDQSCDFNHYQPQVNALLAEDGIGWRLNEKSELVRVRPKVLTDNISNTSEKLDERFAQARLHFLKAERYLQRHPIDEANSIKEIISAVESVARTIEPKASTLGDAVKRLKRSHNFNPSLLEPLEKLYAYSNGAAAVRHGHTSGSTPSIAEAELALLIGVGYIRYLIECSNSDPKNG